MTMLGSRGGVTDIGREGPRRRVDRGLQSRPRLEIKGMPQARVEHDVEETHDWVTMCIVANTAARVRR